MINATFTVQKHTQYEKYIYTEYTVYEKKSIYTTYTVCEKNLFTKSIYKTNYDKRSILFPTQRILRKWQGLIPIFTNGSFVVITTQADLKLLNGVQHMFPRLYDNLLYPVRVFLIGEIIEAVQVVINREKSCDRTTDTHSLPQSVSCFRFVCVHFRS